MRNGIETDKTRQPVTLPRVIRLTLAFDGSAYHGWQLQKNRPTVQGALAEAIRQVTGEHIVPAGSGRTDAGAHARAIVASFMTLSRIPPPALVRALNSVLPADIRILAAARAPDAFHARRSARAKVYRYQVYRGAILPPHLARDHFHYPYPLDLRLMQVTARLLVGEHDFASFAARSGSAMEGSRRGTVRRILRAELRQRGHRLWFTVEGDGFLHHMVRNMIGTLLDVGRGRITPERFCRLFDRRDRTLAGFTAPAHGLILLKVRY